MNQPIKKVVVDDDEAILTLVKNIFNKNGIDNYKVFNNYDALKNELDHSVEIAVIDYFIGDITGQHVIEHIKQLNHDCQIIIMSGSATMDILIDIINTHMQLSFVDKSKANWGDKLLMFVNDACNHIILKREKLEEDFQFYLTNRIKPYNKEETIQNTTNES